MFQAHDGLVAGAPGLVTRAPGLVAGAPGLVTGAPGLVARGWACCGGARTCYEGESRLAVRDIANFGGASTFRLTVWAPSGLPCKHFQAYR